MSMAVTVADAVTTRDALAVPGPRSITVPLDGWPMAGEASTTAMRTATRRQGIEGAACMLVVVLELSRWIS